jgi:hypothetical protein
MAHKYSKYEIATWTGLADVEASCECGWESRAKNAMGNAKQHAMATGHVVVVLQQTSVTYGPPGLTREQVRERIRYFGD